MRGKKTRGRKNTDERGLHKNGGEGVTDHNDKEDGKVHEIRKRREMEDNALKTEYKEEEERINECSGQEINGCEEI